MHAFRRFSLVGLASLVACLSLGPLHVHPLAAQGLRETTSLRFVPGSAAFYSAMFNADETYGAFFRSRAFAKLRALPVVQQGIAKVRREIESGDLSQVREFLAQAENKELAATLLDAVSHEIFVFGDARHGKWIGTAGRLSNQLNLAQMRAELQGEDTEEAMVAAVVDLFDQNPDLLHFPASVFGFRIQDAAAVEKQIDRLEALLKQLAANDPRLEGKLTRETIGKGHYLSARIEGTLVPWDEVLEDLSLDPDASEKLVDKLSQLKLSIHLGVFEQYLILALGDDDAQLRTLGQGPYLAEHARMQPIAKYFDKTVRSVGFANDEFLQDVAGVQPRMHQMRDMFKTLLERAPLPEDVTSDLDKDADLFFEQVIELQPKMGAVAAVTYDAPRGFETISYNWAEHKTLNSTQPLTLTSHVGGDPIGFFVTHKHPATKELEFMELWVGKLANYVDRIATPFLNPEQTELYSKAKEKLLPLAARAQTVCRDLIDPGFADNQQGIIFDARLKSPQWHMSMPKANEPLSLPELSFVCSVSDAAKVKSAGTEYFSILQDTINALSELAPDKIPPYPLPTPQERDFGPEVGTVYYYAIPPFLGLDPSVAPNMGLSPNTFVCSLVPKATQRLLTDTPLQRAGATENTESRAIATIWQFHMDRFVELIRPWVRYGFQIAEQEGTQDAELVSQVHTVLDVIGCMKLASGIAYVEDDAVVSQSRIEFEDLAP